MSNSPDSLETALAELNERQRRFCELYAGRCAGNGTRAAGEAGYEGDKATLAVTAYRLLRNDKILSVLAAFHEGDDLTASRLEHQHFLTRVMRGEEKEMRFVRDEDGNGTFEPCPPTIRDRMQAQDQLARLGGYYVTKVAPTNAAGEDLTGATMEQLITWSNMKGS